MAGGPTRQDTQQVTLQIKNPDTDDWAVFWPNSDDRIFDKKTGGEVDSDIYKYKPGGMRKQRSLGGSKNTGDLTLTRNYVLELDHGPSIFLSDWVGRAKCTVSQTMMDIDGNPYGKPTVWVGYLKTVTFPEHDSESSDPAMLEVVVSPDGPPFRP